MSEQSDEDYHAEVDALVEGFHGVSAGHEHQKVLHALGGFLVDCVDDEFFAKSISLDDRIKSLMALMTGLVLSMAKRKASLQ